MSGRKLREFMASKKTLHTVAAKLCKVILCNDEITKCGKIKMLTLTVDHQKCPEN